MGNAQDNPERDGAESVSGGASGDVHGDGDSQINEHQTDGVGSGGQRERHGVMGESTEGNVPDRNKTSGQCGTACTCSTKEGSVSGSGLEYNGIILREASADISGNVTFQDFKAFIDECMVVAEDKGLRKWYIGDCLNDGEQRFGDRFLHLEERLLRQYDQASLYNMKSLSKRIPKSVRVRPTKLSWSAHRVVQALPEGDQKEWLQTAAGEGWGANAFTEHLHAHQIADILNEMTQEERAEWNMIVSKVSPTPTQLKKMIAGEMATDPPLSRSEWWELRKDDEVFLALDTESMVERTWAAAVLNCRKGKQ